MMGYGPKPKTKALTYEQIVAKSNMLAVKENSSFKLYAAPLTAKPKRSGRGDTHRYDAIKKAKLVGAVKTVIEDAEKYQMKKYYPCVKCSRHVGLINRRKQANRFVPGKGYTGLECSLHLTEKEGR